MSTNTNFSKENSLLGRTLLKIPLLSFIPPSGGCSLLTPSHPFPKFSFIPTTAAPGCSLWAYPTQPESQSQGGSVKTNFSPNWQFHAQPCSLKPAPTLLVVPRTWMKTAFVHRKVLTDQTAKQIPGSPHIPCHVQKSGADLFECCILLQLAQLCQVSIELFHRSTPWPLYRPDRAQVEMSSHSSSDC